MNRTSDSKQIKKQPAVLADHLEKLKESEKQYKYLDLARELKKKLWNLKVTVIPTVVGALCTIPKGVIKGLEDWEIRGVEPIQTSVF